MPQWTPMTYFIGEDRVEASATARTLEVTAGWRGAATPRVQGEQGGRGGPRRLDCSAAWRPITSGFSPSCYHTVSVESRRPQNGTAGRRRCRAICPISSVWPSCATKDTELISVCDE